MSQFLVGDILDVDPGDLEATLPLVALVPSFKVLFEIDVGLHLSDTDEMTAGVNAEQQENGVFVISSNVDIVQLDVSFFSTAPHVMFNGLIYYSGKLYQTLSYFMDVFFTVTLYDKEFSLFNVMGELFNISNSYGKILKQVFIFCLTIDLCGLFTSFIFSLVSVHLMMIKLIFIYFFIPLWVAWASWCRYVEYKYIHNYASSYRECSFFFGDSCCNHKHRGHIHKARNLLGPAKRAQLP